MRPSKAEVLEWERRWAASAGLAALASIGLLVAGILVETQVVGTGGGNAQFLRNIDAHRSAQMIADILQALGVGLLAAPLFYLFRAGRARSEKMRGQLVGVVVAAPLFLAVFYVLAGFSALHAATGFVAKDVTGVGAHANTLATTEITNAPLQGLTAGFGFAGRLGFAIAMVYTSLYAMRTGLLSRFWGALGLALGAVSVLFFEPAVLWFIYLAFLLLGRVPGGRPRAWAAGEAIPWPTPGEKASAALSAGNGNGPPSADPEAPPSPEPQNGERRKRKQRD